MKEKESGKKNKSEGSPLMLLEQKRRTSQGKRVFDSLASLGSEGQAEKIRKGKREQSVGDTIVRTSRTPAKREIAVELGEYM